jgi:hypothetical protein
VVCCVRDYGDLMGEPLRILRVIARGRGLGKIATLATVAAVAVFVLAAGGPVGYAATGPALMPGDSQPSTFDTTGGDSMIGAMTSVLAGAQATVTPSPTMLQVATPTFRSLGISTPGPALKGEWVDPSRLLPVQATDWATLKAAGRVAIVDGKITILAADANPMVNQTTGIAIPDSVALDTSWTRWVLEVVGIGRDEKGTYYRDLNYWKLCGDGAITVALWYWQQLTGYPDVTGTAGYFLDPYVAQGSYWPSSGLRVALRGHTKLGTYWSGSDSVNGYTANGRGFEMYLATAAQPATWTTPGLAVYRDKIGNPLYPTYGTDQGNILAGLNWEASGHDASTWGTAYYTTIMRTDSTLTRDLKAAVMLDVGRDGVPVVAAVDTYYLPNWQASSGTPHSSHAISIVGYDNTANPPTYTYIDTCGHSCNQSWGNHNGDLHVIAQSQLVLAMRYRQGAGFTW